MGGVFVDCRFDRRFSNVKGGFVVAQSISLRVKAVPVTTASPLSVHDFADAFAVCVPKNKLEAVDIAHLALTPMPHWISALLVLRDRMIAPFRLKKTTAAHDPDIVTIGIFPIESSRPDQVVLGFDDAHLDFRIVIDAADHAEADRLITATTFVKTHNALGRGYLAAVLPFHKMIARALMARMARRVAKENSN